MRLNRMFRWLWRFNAVVIAGGGLLAIAVLMYAGYHIARDLTRTRHTTAIVNVGEDNDIAATWIYGNLQQIRGSELVILPLQSQQNYAFGGSGAKQSVSTRNLLFVDTRSGTQRWLFANNEALITDYGFLPNDYQAKEEARPAVVAFYHVVAGDTDGDDRMDGNDAVTFAVSHPDGTGYTELFANTDAVLGHLLHHPDQLLVTYQRAYDVHLATVRLSDLAIVSDNKIAPPGVGE